MTDSVFHTKKLPPNFKAKVKLFGQDLVAEARIDKSVDPKSKFKLFGVVEYFVPGGKLAFTYKGRFNKDCLPSGKGKLNSANTGSDYFCDYWQNGVMNETTHLKDVHAKSLKGCGEIDFSNGDIYIGEMLDGEAHGYGKIIYRNGNVYRGELQHGKRHGKGLMICETYGYKGDFKDDMMHGEGRITFKNGAIFEGAFADNCYNGKITFYDKDGKKFEGYFENGITKSKTQKYKERKFILLSKLYSPLPYYKEGVIGQVAGVYNIKPRNVRLIEEDDEVEKVNIADFICKRTEGDSQFQGCEVILFINDHGSENGKITDESFYKNQLIAIANKIAEHNQNKKTKNKITRLKINAMVCHGHQFFKSDWFREFVDECLAKDSELKDIRISTNSSESYMPLFNGKNCYDAKGKTVEMLFCASPEELAKWQSEKQKKYGEAETEIAKEAERPDGKKYKTPFAQVNKQFASVDDFLEDGYEGKPQAPDTKVKGLSKKKVTRNVTLTEISTEH